MRPPKSHTEGASSGSARENGPTPATVYPTSEMTAHPGTVARHDASWLKGRGDPKRVKSRRLSDGRVMLKKRGVGVTSCRVASIGCFLRPSGGALFSFRERPLSASVSFPRVFP